MIIRLRESSRFKNREAFCDADPQFSIPTLDRAERSDCCFKATLQKIATKLGLSSWEELRDDQDIGVEPVIDNPIRQIWRTEHSFGSFDETKDGGELLEKVKLLLGKDIPFIIIAFSPANSVYIEVEVEYLASRDIALRYVRGELAPLGITHLFTEHNWMTGVPPSNAAGAIEDAEYPYKRDIRPIPQPEAKVEDT